MSGRRAANNRIRGPQSALTDYLASNNISAAQIAADYERRRREVQQAADREAVANGSAAHSEEREEREESGTQKRKRKQQEKALAKIKSSKGFKRQKIHLKGEPGEDDDDDIAWDMYTKKTPLPGQLENCELCDKRFTVTAYSKTGPEGGLLCTKCSKEQEAQEKKNQKPKNRVMSGGQRRQRESDILDGILPSGPRSLQDLCIKTIADNIHEINEFGDLPPSLLKRLSQILSRRRVLNSRTLDLFLRPDLDTIDVYDCGRLEVEDYKKLFSIVPKVRKLNLQNAGQFKDEVIDYILERNTPLEELQLEAANLVSNEKWIEFFERAGHGLESLKLSWLDYSMDDNTFMHLIRSCPNLKQLKMRKCFRIGDLSVGAISELKHLEHLSLQLPLSPSSTATAELIQSIGSNLRTLSLEDFGDADDNVLASIHSSCIALNKLRFTQNDTCIDMGFVSLFSDWSNPPLSIIDFSSNRSIDYTQPDGPEEPTGLASAGFSALMNHSGSNIERLDICSCRHITYQTFAEVFDGKRQYPNLKGINISFLTRIDTAIVAGMLRSCPRLVKIVAFGCFNVKDVAMPKGVAIIGLPHAHDSIVQEGDFDADLWNALPSVGEVFA